MPSVWIRTGIAASGEKRLEAVSLNTEASLCLLLLVAPMTAASVVPKKSVSKQAGLVERIEDRNGAGVRGCG